jgi:hypothetical protein
MTEFHPVPGPGPPNPNDRPEVWRCIVGRPTRVVVQSNSVAYHHWKCNKHRNEELFEGNMRIDMGLPEREHA